MDFTSVLKSLAPTVFSAMLGPAGAIAVTALGEIMGVDKPTQESIQKQIAAGQMTPEQITKIKELELQYQNDEKERGFKYAELEFKDTASAREMQVAVKSTVVPTLAYVIVGSFIAMVAGTLLGYAHVDSVLAGTLVGYLSAKCEQVVGFYFGSSHGSQQKDVLLAQK